MSALLLILILVLVFAACFILLRQITATKGEEVATEALGEDLGPKKPRSLLQKMSRPAYLRIIPLTKNIKVPDWRRKKARAIVAAGMGAEISVEELLAYKFFLAVLALLLLALFNHTASWWSWPVAALIGFYFPDRWLSERVKLRARQITRALPHLVDMLALSVEAGLDFMAAIGKVVKKSKPSPLVEEMSTMLGEVRMGASRADGLRNLAQRCNVTSLSTFVAVLVQADRLGVSIGNVLRAQSEKMRTDRFQEAERQGAMASQKILFPLILCIMPAVFIVILGPLILKYVFGG